MSLLKLPEKYPYAFLLFLVALISVTTLSSSFLFIDDLMLIVKNPKLGFSLQHVLEVFSKPLGQIYDASEYQIKFIYYRPALNLLYMLNNAVWGINPVGFHLTNIFLHLLTTLIVYRSGLILFKGDKTISLLGAALFCVLPVHNELIGRVAMNENLLGFFIALSLYLYLQGKKNLCLAFFCLALLSKESAIMVPFVICLFGIKDASFKGAASSLKPFLIVIICYLVIRTAVIGIPDGAMIDSSLSGILLTSCSALGDYLRLLLVPYPLNVYYPVMKITAVLQPEFLVSLLVCLLLGVAIWKIRSDKVLLSLLAGTIIMLVPAIFLANKLILGSERGYIAERQLYIPSILFSLFVAGMLLKYTGLQSRKYVVSCLYVIILVFSYKTATASTVWLNDEAFYARFSRDFPETFISHKYKGETLLEKGDLDSALVELRAALPSRPAPLASVQEPADISKTEPIQKNIKSSSKKSLFKQSVNSDSADSTGQKFKSMSGLLQHYDIASYQPEFAEVHFLIGKVYLAQGDTGRAIKKFRTALVLQPKSVRGRAFLAEVYLKNGMVKEAQREFKLVMSEINKTGNKSAL